MHKLIFNLNCNTNKEWIFISPQNQFDFAGWLYDVLGAYSYGFYFSGAMIFLSGVMLFALPKLQQKQAQQNKDIYEEEEESGFPEIVEEEGYDSDDHQMTMEAKPKK